METLIDPNKFEIRNSGLLVPKENLLKVQELAEYLRMRMARLILAGITGAGKTYLQKFLQSGLSGINKVQDTDNPFQNTNISVSTESLKSWEFISVDRSIKEDIDPQQIANIVTEVLSEFAISNELIRTFYQVWNSQSLPDSEKPAELKELIETLEKATLNRAHELKIEAIAGWEAKRKLILNGLKNLGDDENLDLVTLWAYQNKERQERYDTLEAQSSLSMVATQKTGGRKLNRLGGSTGSLIKLTPEVFGSIAQQGTLIHLFSDDILASVTQASGKPVGISHEIEPLQISREDKLFLELLKRSREYVLKSHIHLIREQDLVDGKIRDMVDFISLVVEKLGKPEANHKEVVERFNAMLRSEPVAEKLRQIAEVVKSSTAEESAQA